MPNNLHHAVSRLLRWCQWTATVVFLICAYAVTRDTFYLEPISRALFLTVALLPPVLFLVGLYFYEEQYFRLFDFQWIGSTLVFLVLLSPAILFNWRFTFAFREYTAYALGAAGVLLAITSALPAQADDASGHVLWKLLLHYKRVMVDAWSTRSTGVILAPSLAAEQLARIEQGRRRFYANAEDLLAFQQTLTCPEQDAIRLQPHLCALLRRKAALKVVDIGGGEGRFTSNLLAGLESRGLQPQSLLNIDPAAALQERYAIEVMNKSSLQSRAISFESRGVEEVIPPECDVLLASHSLYAALDRARLRGESAAEGLIQRLLTCLPPHGIMALIMSSESSVAIRVKQEAYRLLYGTSTFDTIAEFLDPCLPRAGRVEKKLQSDTVIDVTAILRSYEEHGVVSPEFRRWASYFLRLDLAELSERHVLVIADLILRNSLRLAELAESLQVDALKVTKVGLRSDSRVLPHKAIIYLLRPATTSSKPPRG